MKVGLFMKMLAFMIAGLIFFIFYLYFFVGFNDIIEVFRSIDPFEYSFYYLASITALLVSMLFYSMSWNCLMRALSINVGLKKSLTYCWLGNFVDLIIPFETVSGEITRVYLVYKETGSPSGKIIASVVVHRIITMFITLSGLIFASTFLIVKYNIGAETLYLLLLIILGSLLSLGILFYLALSEEATGKIIDMPIKIITFLIRGRFDPSDLREKAYQNLMHFHSGFKFFSKNRRALAESITYSFAAWFLHLSIYFLVFYALGLRWISIKICETIVVYSVSVALQYTPIAPPLGLVEIVMTSLYTLFKVPAAVSGTATLLIRAITFWFQIVVGYAVAQWIGVKNLLLKSFKETST
jgi:uncharacterized protein (TIRG00374 family)